MTRGPTQTCIGCRFWENNGGDVRDEEMKARYGECRRHAPAFLPHGSQRGAAGWPTTRDDKSCGEFQSKAGDRRI